MGFSDWARRSVRSNRKLKKQDAYFKNKDLLDAAYGKRSLEFREATQEEKQAVKRSIRERKEKETITTFLIYAVVILLSVIAIILLSSYLPKWIS